MQKKFLTNLGLLLFLNLLVKPFWVIGIDRSVQNVVGAEEYGFYFSILNFSFLFNMFLDLGITNFNNRNIAQNAQLLNKHFSSIVILKIMLGALYVLITFVVGFIIGYDTRQFEMLMWIVLNQFILSFVLYLRSNISGLLLFKTDSLLSVLDRLLMIIFCSILLWGNVTKVKFQIEWFVYAQTMAYTITMLIALTVVIKKSAFRRLHWNRLFFIMILKKSFPFALLTLLMMSSYKIDPVFIERLLDDKIGKIQAGIYAQGYRLFDASNMIAYLFSILLLPIFSRMIKQKQQIENMVRLSFSILITISLIAAVSSYFYRTEIINLLYPQLVDESLVDYNERLHVSAKIFSLLMFGFIAISTSYVFGTLLTANGNLLLLNIIAAAGIGTSVVLNIILVPRFLSLGSAYACLSAQFLMILIQLIASYKIFKFSINKKFLFSLIGFFISMVLVAVGMQSVFDSWVINYLFTVLFAFGLSLAFKLLNVTEFIRILKTEKV